MKDCRLFAVFVNAREVMIAPFGASSRLLGRFWTQLATTFCPEVVQEWSRTVEVPSKFPESVRYSGRVPRASLASRARYGILK